MLTALPTDAIWVRTSTIGVAGVERVAALAEDDERSDVILIGSPVSGSSAGSGQWTIFASGQERMETIDEKRWRRESAHT